MKCAAATSQVDHVPTWCCLAWPSHAIGARRARVSSGVLARSVRGPAPCPPPEVIDPLVGERDPSAAVMSEHDAKGSPAVAQPPPLDHTGADAHHRHGMGGPVAFEPQ